MGLFKRFINDTRSNPGPEIDHSHDKIATPANAMTLSRVPLAYLAAQRLYKGKRLSSFFTLAMAASDAEGNVARYIDKKYPDSGRGTTNHGKLADPIADTAGLLTVSTGALLSQRVSPAAKCAIGLVLGVEANKAAWAYRQASSYKKATGKDLKPNVSLEGKEAMAEKFTALLFAVATSEVEPGWKQSLLGAVAVGFAVSGTIRGESARRDYSEVINGALTDFKAEDVTTSS